MERFAVYETPFGHACFEWNDHAITSLRFISDEERALCTEGEPSALSDLAASQLIDYCYGTLQVFTVPIEYRGTPFQCAVWDALRTIPYGETRTYGQIAQMIGNPKAMRAVGAANNRNPLPIIVPCHRVVGTHKALVGYSYGVEMKQRLLTLEAQYALRK